MTITPDRARELLDGVTPGPWTASREYPEYFMQVYSAEDRWGVTDNGVVEDDDAVLIAAAPDLAQTIAGMTEEWGVQHGTTVICLDFYGTEDEESGHIRWTPDRPRAEAWKKTMEDCFPGETYRLVRRPVGSAVVVEGE